MVESAPLPVASPRPEPPVSVAPKPDQADANLEVYEQIFRKCLATADRILTDAGLSGIADRKIQVAVTLFEQFYADQSGINTFERQTRAVMEGVQSVLEGRR